MSEGIACTSSVSAIQARRSCSMRRWGPRVLSWTYVAPAVAGFARACVYDRAGLGWSDAGPLPVPRRASWTSWGASWTPRTFAAVRAGRALVRGPHGAAVPAPASPDVAGLVLLDPRTRRTGSIPSPRTRVDPPWRAAVRLRAAGGALAHPRRRGRSCARRRAGQRPRHRLARRPGRAQADRRRTARACSEAPPDVRAMAQRAWTHARFYEALGSQIGSIGESAAAVPVDQDFGDVPLVVVSGEANSDAGQLSRQARLARRSRRGRHVVAERSGHWIPLDRPDVVVEAVREVVARPSERDTHPRTSGVAVPAARDWHPPSPAAGGLAPARVEGACPLPYTSAPSKFSSCRLTCAMNWSATTPSTRRWSNPIARYPSGGWQSHRRSRSRASRWRRRRGSRPAAG